MGSVLEESIFAYCEKGSNPVVWLGELLSSGFGIAEFKLLQMQTFDTLGQPAERLDSKEMSVPGKAT